MRTRKKQKPIDIDGINGIKRELERVRMDVWELQNPPILEVGDKFSKTRTVEFHHVCKGGEFGPYYRRYCMIGDGDGDRLYITEDEVRLYLGL